MSDKPEHKSTSYSGKKPYLTHNYRTMMKRKTQEEYYFHELHKDPMSELLRPYLDDPEIDGFGWEYMGPRWGWPPFEYPGAGPGGGVVGPYDDDDGLPPQEGCESCKIVGSGSIECGNAWFGQVIPSQCAGFITFAVGLDGQSFHTSVNDSGAIVVAVPSDTDEVGMIVCSSGGIHGVTCCLSVDIDCCCQAISVSGAATVNPSATWTGTISPACPGASCDVTSNSGCTLSCSVNGAGSQVTVTPGAADCGSFTVTVTEENPGCSNVATKVVRINDTGQGGSWVEISRCEEYKYCKDGCYGTYATTVDCSVGKYRWAGQRWCCLTWLEPGQPCGSKCPPGNCPPNDCYPVPCHPGTGACAGWGACVCSPHYYYWYSYKEWKCTC